MEPDRQLEARAEQTARKLLSEADPDAVRERARQLADLTFSCRARQDHSGADNPPDAGHREAPSSTQTVSWSRGD